MINKKQFRVKIIHNMMQKISARKTNIFNLTGDKITNGSVSNYRETKVKKLNLFKLPNNNKTYSRRNDKIAVQMKECLSISLLKSDLYDLHCHTITITHIDLSPDLRNARIFVMPFGGEKIRETIDYLEKHKHYFKNIIAIKMKLRFIPEITFKNDDSFEYSARIEKLLRKHHCNKL